MFVVCIHLEGPGRKGNRIQKPVFTSVSDRLPEILFQVAGDVESISNTKYPPATTILYVFLNWMRRLSSSSRIWRKIGYGMRFMCLVFHLNSGETRLRDTTDEGRQQIRIVPA